MNRVVVPGRIRTRQEPGQVLSRRVTLKSSGNPIFGEPPWSSDLVRTRSVALRAYPIPVSRTDEIWDQEPKWLAWGECDHMAEYIEYLSNPNPGKTMSLSIESPDPMAPSITYTYPAGLGGCVDDNWPWDGYTGIYQLSVPTSEKDLPAVAPFLARAVRSMTPGITANLSSIVSAVELRDLLPTLFAPWTIAKRLCRKYPTRPIRSLIDASIDVNFTNRFGNQQIVRDVTSVYLAYLQINDRVRNLIEYAGKNCESHYSEPATVFPYTWEGEDGGASWSPIGPGGYYIPHRNRSAQLSRKMHCTLRYRYTLADMLGRPLVDPAVIKRLATLDAFGINLNPSIIWDLVPFSFVVDYVVSVGSWLESFTQKNVQPVVEIFDAMYSVKDTQTSLYRNRCRLREEWRDDPTNTLPLWWGEESASITTKHYVRRRFVPIGDWLHGEELNFRAPSWSQIVVSLSLLWKQTSRRSAP